MSDLPPDRMRPKRSPQQSQSPHAANTQPVIRAAPASSHSAASYASPEALVAVPTADVDADDDDEDLSDHANLLYGSAVSLPCCSRNGGRCVCFGRACNGWSVMACVVLLLVVTAFVTTLLRQAQLQAQNKELLWRERAMETNARRQTERAAKAEQKLLEIAQTEAKKPPPLVRSPLAPATFFADFPPSLLYPSAATLPVWSLQSEAPAAVPAAAPALSTPSNSSSAAASAPAPVSPLQPACTMLTRVLHPSYAVGHWLDAPNRAYPFVVMPTDVQGRVKYKNPHDFNQCDVRWAEHHGLPYDQIGRVDVPNARRPEMMREWQPSSNCSVNSDWKPATFCSALRGYHMIFVGDSITEQHFDSLIMTLQWSYTGRDDAARIARWDRVVWSDEMQSAFGYSPNHFPTRSEHTAKYYRAARPTPLACALLLQSVNSSLSMLDAIRQSPVIGNPRNDQINVAGMPDMDQEQFEPQLEAPWIQDLPTRRLILVLNSGIHVIPLANYERILRRTFTYLREHYPTAIIIARATYAGIPDCENPLQDPPAQPDASWHWDEVPARNEAFLRILTEVYGAPEVSPYPVYWLDDTGPIDQSRGGHHGSFDCLHYCAPGPQQSTVDALVQLLLQLRARGVIADVSEEEIHRRPPYNPDAPRWTKEQVDEFVK